MLEFVVYLKKKKKVLKIKHIYAESFISTWYGTVASWVSMGDMKVIKSIVFNENA